MIHYVIQIVAFQLLFLIVYDAFLKRETFFNWNRAYLLGTAVLSILLPLIKIESFRNVVPQVYTFSFPKFAFETQNPIVLNEVVLKGTSTSNSILSHVPNILLLGCILALLYFLFRIFQILKLAYTNPKVKEKDFSIIQVSNSTLAFSFFHYVFIGEKIKTQERESILKHELVHIEQKHTWDLLFFEILRVVFWFNPLVYMYQNRISDLHEFIADSKAIKQNKKQYYENLLSQVFDIKSVSFINPFFKQSLIKKRIIMLQKSKSKKIQLLKYTLLIPVVFGMLLYSSCSQDRPTKDVAKQEYSVSNESQEKASSEVLQSIADLKESIAAKGSMTDEEKNALKTLMMLVSPDGLKEPYFKDVVKYAEIPYGVIEQVPAFPGCEKVETREESINCMSKELNSFILKNFNTNLSNDLGLTGEQKISVFFKIDANGQIIDIKARANHPDLENEAIRVVSILPTMIPGEQDGVKVTVPYYLPIKFQIKE